MNKSIVGGRSVAARAPYESGMIEALESRRLLSVSPVTHLAPSALAAAITLKPATPAKILAGRTGFETVTIRNSSAASETQDISITLAPSLDGTTAAGSYSTPGVTETLTIKAHGSATVKVPFIPPATLAAGRYRTLAYVQVGFSTTLATAPGAYTLVLPPGSTTTPSLIGHYAGLILATSSTGGAHGTHSAGFGWETTDQTDSTLTGLFAVGSGQAAGVMTGAELTTGVIQFTFTSDDITYTIKGKVTPDGSRISGTFKGVLLNNIFKKLNGNFRLSRQAS